MFTTIKLLPFEKRVLSDTMQIENIFNDYLKQKPVFLNKEALTLKWIPEKIHHREDQIKNVASILAPTLKGEKSSNLFIYGKTGTGKTVVCNLVGKELEKTSANNGHKIKVIYVNCKMKRVADTEYRLLAYLLKEFGQEVPFTGLPTEQIYRKFFENIDKESQNIIIIIDEIDALIEKTGDEILYNLTRINQELKNAKLSIIGITNDLNFIERLDPRIKSSLGEEELIFPPYNALQIQDILKQRANIAFVEGILDEGVIEKCSALAAQEHGDARRALDLLRVAGELAERECGQKITTSHIDKAQEKIDIDRILETIKIQPKQSQLVLHTIITLAEKNSEIQTGDVFNLYQNLCQQHRMKPLTPRRISDLIAELDLFSIINTKVVSRGRHGRTRIIMLNVVESIQKKIKNFLFQTFS